MIGILQSFVLSLHLPTLSLLLHTRTTCMHTSNPHLIIIIIVTDVHNLLKELEVELQQVKERLQQKQSDLETAEQTVESLTTINVLLEEEKGQLKHQLQVCVCYY